MFRAELLNSALRISYAKYKNLTALNAGNKRKVRYESENHSSVCRSEP